MSDSELSTTMRDLDDTPPTTLADNVHRRIRNDILLGRLRPNQLLVESEIAERMQVSRTPVRETLQRLATEGLIVSRHRRWTVYEHTPSEIREIYEIRMALEGFAARLACERATESQLAEIAAVIERDPDSGQLHGEARVEANDRFHNLIVAAANNRRLAEQVQRSRQYYFNSYLASLYTPAQDAASQQQHLDLFTAIQARDGDRAEALTRAHIGHALSFILDRR